MEANQNSAESATETNDESGGSKDGLKPIRETRQKGEEDAENRDGTSEEYHKEPDSTSTVSNIDRGKADEQEPVDKDVSSLERMPSYGGFANLDEEFAARSTSRELARRDNTADEKGSDRENDVW
jgi:hypothetical protein